MKRYALAILAIAGLLFGCSAVYAPQPMGDKAVKLDSSWAGTWLSDDGTVSTTVIDAANGLLQFAWLETKDKGIQMESYRVVIRARGDTMFANVRDEESEHGYHWFLVKKKSDRLALVWGPDAEQFARAIDEKALPGRRLHPDDPKRDDVLLGELEPEHIDRIIDPASGLLDWKDPLVLIRMAD